MTTSRYLRDPASGAESLLQRVALFRNMPPEMLRQLATHLQQVSFRSGRDIFHEGDPGSAMFIVLSGTVRIYIPSASGRDVVLAVHRDGDIFGEMALLDHGPRSASAQTIEPAQMLRLNASDFDSVLEDHPEAARAIIEVLVERLRQTNQSIQDAYLLDVPGRLARRLLLISEEHGHDVDAGRELGLRVSQQELANMIGASRVAVNKQLQAWRQNGIVNVNRQRITILDPEALEREFTLSQ